MQQRSEAFCLSSFQALKKPQMEVRNYNRPGAEAQREMLLSALNEAQQTSALNEQLQQ
jgi:hypothetical protein